MDQSKEKESSKEKSYDQENTPKDKSFNRDSHKKSVYEEE
jgi:hypothetical protein